MKNLIALMMVVLLVASSAFSQEHIWGRGAGETFYGIPVGFASGSYLMNYDFERIDEIVVYDSIDRSDPTPANWPVNTVGGTSPWQTTYDGPIPVFAGFATAEPKHDEIGNTGLELINSVDDNGALNFVMRDGSLYADINGVRDMAVEFRMGMTDPDDMDMWMGICNAASTGIVNTDGSLDGVTHAGFHWLRTNASSFPALVTSNGAVTPISTPTIPTWDGAAADTWTKFGLKISSREDVEWYVNDQLVGIVELPADYFQFEVRVCFGFVTNGQPTDETMIDYIKVVTTRI